MSSLLKNELMLLSRAAKRPCFACPNYRNPSVARQNVARGFRTSAGLKVVKPYLLADIGEGITEVQVIQWFVEPGARVEQFDKICEVQSDKAAVEITSRFDGVIKKLYYEADDMARVGKPLVDIDIQSEISPADEALTKVPGEQQEEKPSKEAPKKSEPEPTDDALGESSATQDPEPAKQPERPRSKHQTLATPAVRHLTRKLNVDIADVPGTGKDGRVLKEDVQNYQASQSSASAPTSTSTSTSISPFAPVQQLAEDKTVPLTPIQKQMFKTMTRSLSIPHFLYTDTIDFTSLSALRRKLNTTSSSNPSSNPQKLSALPFILKAVSLALHSHPTLNAHLDTSNEAKPALILKSSHDIGVAMDTPSGLLVPVIRSVQTHTITSLAAELSRLSTLARTGKLSSSDLSGATFTVSNVGSIGGGVVAPVIVGPQVAILGVGRARTVPAFAGNGELVRREEAVFSWSADHRVVDGAGVARCAEEVRALIEEVEGMVVRMR
ncbi:hypothetical protein K402DRAFT_350067 [Aulographum hederae CBS 113979]|uniref:Dihydrolipoamide acetyltransferase component of pyruvate dehydrogenase complex n=1 Tax=Aulographum hederae CBS 113979 TaxID=1176131 RepID=A0A6G1H887_9PEZI|nr:hypothetical protein K402DRAFT_350067 [Aulographum hederae CBS 113979]